jgi:L-ascorbate 6-phosphate lactonase
VGEAGGAPAPVRVGRGTRRGVRRRAGASPEARLVAPFTSRDTLVEARLDESRIVVPEVGEPLEVSGATVTAVPSAHTELEYDLERGYPYLGYVIEWNDVTVYRAGDTVVYDGMVQTLSAWDIDLAFVPINGRDFFRTQRNIIGNTETSARSRSSPRRWTSASSCRRTAT